MIVVTGAGGFIGSCLVSYLNEKGLTDLVMVDASEKREKENLRGKIFSLYVDRSIFIDWFENNASKISFVFHIGARTDTTEWNEAIFDELNVNYTKALWNICGLNNIPFLYASSAATYGDGSNGYSDNHELIPKLKPLNPYGWSKQKLDCWVLEQNKCPDRWAGFKFFNVFGPNEYHKGRMASVIYHAFHQIRSTGKMRLFKSNDPAIKDGDQRRDFIYVKDLLDVLYYFFESNQPNGIYNLGSGQANTFRSLTENVFKAIAVEPQIEFIDMPQDLLKSYQNYTCADMDKLKQIGYQKSMHSFENAIQEYVTEFLSGNTYY